MADIEITGTYCRDNGKPVSLTVGVGNGHKGRIKVTLDGTQVYKGDPVKNLSIGAGSKLLVESVVTVMSPKLNTIVTYNLRNGKGSEADCSGPGDWMSEKEGEDQGDTMEHKAVFTLK